MEPRRPESARESKSPVDRSAGASVVPLLCPDPYKIRQICLHCNRGAFRGRLGSCGDAPNMNAVGRVLTVTVNLVSGHLGLS